jgi:putative colanic acid biosynthesis UDP-glucose lipid carrier transferase
MTPSMKENASILVLCIKLIDSLVIVASGMLCFFSLESIKHFPSYNGYMPENYLTLIVLGFIFSAWWFPKFNVYQSWREASLSVEMRALLFSWSCSLLGLLAFIFFTKTATDFSRHWFILWYISAFFALVIIRLALRWSLHKMRSKGYNLRYIVLVGSGDLSKEVINKIQSSPWMGLKIQGYFFDITITDGISLPCLGEVKDIISYVKENSIDQVWITLPLKEIEQIETLCNQLHSVLVEVKLVPNIASLRLLKHATTEINGMTIINLSRPHLSSTDRLIKWLEDKVLALLILVIISPLLLIIAIAIKLTSPGPIFYRQERVGSNGKAFQMLKFRSMPVNADKDSVWGNAKAKQKTNIGQFLRKTSFDELPQFINVLTGDMSIVGPRPERTVFVDQFKYEIDSYMQKHIVQAGITGWAQVNGWRGDTCLKTRLEYDLYYIENWSLWFDLKIIWMTLYKGLNNGQ